MLPLSLRHSTDTPTHFNGNPTNPFISTWQVSRRPLAGSAAWRPSSHYLHSSAVPAGASLPHSGTGSWPRPNGTGGLRVAPTMYLLATRVATASCAGGIRHPAQPSLLVTEYSLRVTHSHREGFPCSLLIPLAHMPSPLPRRDRSSLVAGYSTSGGLPHRSGRSAPALRVSRSARRSLPLWPACSPSRPSRPFPSEGPAISLPPSPLRLQRAGAKVVGEELHLLKIDALARRTTGPFSIVIKNNLEGPRFPPRTLFGG
jgi:hypothetical protein